MDDPGLDPGQLYANCLPSPHPSKKFNIVSSFFCTISVQSSSIVEYNSAKLGNESNLALRAFKIAQKTCSESVLPAGLNL